MFFDIKKKKNRPVTMLKSFTETLIKDQIETRVDDCIGVIQKVNIRINEVCRQLCSLKLNVNRKLLTCAGSQQMTKSVTMVTRIVTTLRFCFSIRFGFFSMCTPDAFLFHKCSTISE